MVLSPMARSGDAAARRLGGRALVDIGERVEVPTEAEWVPNEAGGAMHNDESYHRRDPQEMEREAQSSELEDQDE
jgi:hypothetical protein